MEPDDALMGKCSCANLRCCSEIPKLMISGRDSIMHGCFEIEESKNEKIIAFRKMLFTTWGLMQLSWQI